MRGTQKKYSEQAKTVRGEGQICAHGWCHPPTSQTQGKFCQYGLYWHQSWLMFMCKSTYPIRDLNTGTKQLRCFALPLELIGTFYTRDNSSYWIHISIPPSGRLLRRATSEYVGASKGTAASTPLVPPAEKIKVPNLEPPWGDETWSTEEVLRIKKTRLLRCQRGIRMAGVRSWVPPGHPPTLQERRCLQGIVRLDSSGSFRKIFKSWYKCTMRHVWRISCRPST